MALEQNINSIHIAKQTAKGTPATAPTSAATGKRYRWVGGDLALNREDGSEAFSDAEQYGDAQHYVNTIIGQGNPGFEATPDELAHLLWLFNAQETVTDVVGPPAKKQHLSVPSSSYPYFTAWKRVGAQVVERQKFNDCVISQLEVTAGSGQRVMRVSPTIVSLDPGEKYATDPTLAMPTVDAFVWQEAEGAVLFNGAVVRGATQYTLTFNRALEPIYSDSPRPHELQPGTSTVAISAAVVLDAAGFALANELLYGTPTPTAGAKPTIFVGAPGSFTVTHTQRNQAGAATGNVAKFELPGVKWTPPQSVAVADPAGGGGTLELTGSHKKVAGQPVFRSTVTTESAAFTA